MPTTFIRYSSKVKEQQELTSVIAKRKQERLRELKRKKRNLY